MTRRQRWWRLAATRPSALARLHALWTLEGLDRLDVPQVLQALKDPDPGVRENAIVLSERWLSQPQVAAALLAMTGDDNARVRFQLLATLGSIETPASQAAQEQLLLAGIEDEWVQVAALSASSDRAIAYFDRALQPGSALSRAGVRRAREVLRSPRRRARSPAEIGRTVTGDRRRDQSSGARGRLVARVAAGGHGPWPERRRRSSEAGRQPGHAADAGNR